jgi:hypothetical protein
LRGKERFMHYSPKFEKILDDKNDNFNNSHKFESINGTLKNLEDLVKTKRFETEKETCALKDTCYIGKTQMGSCPCELYR